MRSPSSLVVLPLFLVLVAACGSDDDTGLFSGGGGAANGGTSATAGRGGAEAAGRGGTSAGVGGTSPDQGGASSGEGGSDGEGGEAGSGGDAGDGGGASAGKGGAAGKGGSAGKGGVAGAGGSAGNAASGAGGGGVETSGCLTNDGSDWVALVPSVCLTIQQALDDVVAGGLTATVLVDPGTYDGDIVFKGARAHVKSVGGREQTTLKGSGQDSVVRFTDGEGAQSILEGFRIEGGVGHENDQGYFQGGGILVDGGAPVLRDLDVTKNDVGSVSGYGGGMFLRDTDAVVQDVRVFDNVAGYYGGGVAIVGGAPKLDGLTLARNTAVYGGGMTIYYSDAQITHTLFAKNDADIGGAVYVQAGAPVIQNVTMLQDTAGQGGAIGLSTKTTAIFRNVDIASSSKNGVGVAVKDSPKAQLLFCNIPSDPPIEGVFQPPAKHLDVFSKYVDISAADPLLWDVHLQPGSLLENQGDPQILDADGSVSDIGRFGGAP